MKKAILLFASLLALGTADCVSAQEDYGYFNSLGVGVGVATTGINVDVATPIGNHFALRAGVSIMPNFTFTTNVDVEGTAEGSGTYTGNMDVEGSLGRTAGEILLNYYPFKSADFFVCGGAAFGGKTIAGLEGHDEALADLAAQGNNASIEIGDYSLPVDKNGNVKGGLKVAGFRPYVGLGWGRAVPKKRLGFMFELGVQFHGTPDVYSDSGSLKELVDQQSGDNTFNDIIDKLTVYPVMKFRLSGKIF